MCFVALFKCSRSWCDRYGDGVLDVVKKEFKDHVGEMESKRNAAGQKHGNSMQWTTFEDDDENCHPNLFAHQDHSFQVMKQKFTSWNNDHNTNDLEKNPFFQDCNEKNVHNLRSESAFSEGHNPFWTPNHDSSLLK